MITDKQLDEARQRVKDQELKVALVGDKLLKESQKLDAFKSTLQAMLAQYQSEIAYETYSKESDWDKLVGRSFPFFGVCDHFIRLGDTVWEIIEDESDGYRSYFETVIKHGDYAAGGPYTFSSAPLDVVEIHRTGKEHAEYNLVSVIDGHVWLSLWTDNSDNYYPSAQISYKPRAPKGQ